MGTEHSSKRLAQQVPSGVLCRFAQNLCPLKSSKYLLRLLCCALTLIDDAISTTKRTSCDRDMVMTLFKLKFEEKVVKF